MTDEKELVYTNREFIRIGVFGQSSTEPCRLSTPIPYHEIYGFAVGVLSHEDDMETIFNDPDIQPWIENWNLVNLEEKYELENFMWKKAGKPTPWMLIGILPPPPPPLKNPPSDVSEITESSSGGG
jgi:hypothetical protein